MSFTVFSYNATVLRIQPNPTQPMDGPNPCPSLPHVVRRRGPVLHICVCVLGDSRRAAAVTKWTSEIFWAKQALLRSVSDKMLSAAFHKSPESVRKQR